MFSEDGPSLRELTVQALSSVEHGYDLLAPKFDRTPYRTPDTILDATAAALRDLGQRDPGPRDPGRPKSVADSGQGQFDSGLDVCCGTGAGLQVLEPLCRELTVGVDFSAGMLDQVRTSSYRVRADARALPFTAAFDLAVTFGALGHFLPSERPAVFEGVFRALRPGGLFAFPIMRPPPVASLTYWTWLTFDAVMRVRNAVLRPPFVMYYRTTTPAVLAADLTAAGFTVDDQPLPGLDDYRLLLARKPGSPQ